MAEELTLTVASSEDADAAEALRLAVLDYNLRATGLAAAVPIVHLLRDHGGIVNGGVAAYVWGSWVQVEWIWVSEPHRNRRWGSLLLEAAEASAQAAGAQHAYVQTFSFQARPFYERHGYRVVGELRGFPPGESYFLMQKDFGQ